MTTKMKPIVLTILAGAALLLLFSCGAKKQNEDITNAVNKNVYNQKYGSRINKVKPIFYHHTLPAPDMENTIAKSTNGDTKNVTSNYI